MREEVKTFQGKPIKVSKTISYTCLQISDLKYFNRHVLHIFKQARIKAKAIAINTFLPKNGFRPLDMSVYTQHRYTASFYLPPVYSPQQHFPLYSLVAPQTWSATHGYLDPPLVSPVLSYCVSAESRVVTLLGASKDQTLRLIGDTDTSAVCCRKTDLLVLWWALHVIGR